MSLVIAVAALVTVTLLYTLFVRSTDIPVPEPVSPTRHLEERRAAIYENLRDLQFEYRVGKLSDIDYQQTKLVLQKELASVIREINQITRGVPAAVQAPTAAAPLAAAKAVHTCAHCGAEFPVALKFCGECGKEMS